MGHLQEADRWLGVIISDLADGKVSSAKMIAAPRLGRCRHAADPHGRLPRRGRSQLSREVVLRHKRHGIDSPMVAVLIEFGRDDDREGAAFGLERQDRGKALWVRGAMDGDPEL